MLNWKRRKLLSRDCTDCQLYHSNFCDPLNCISPTEQGGLKYSLWSDIPLISPEFCECSGETKVVGNKVYKDSYERQRRQCKVCGEKFWVKLERERETPA